MRKRKNDKGKTRFMGLLLCALFAAFMTPASVYATSEVVSKINSLQELVMNIITAAGVIVLAWGIFEFATAYQSHDTSQQTASLKKVISGLIMVFASQIVNMLK